MPDFEKFDFEKFEGELVLWTGNAIYHEAGRTASRYVGGSQGFSIPLKKWLQGKNTQQFFQDILLNTSSIFDKKTINKLLLSNKAGCNNHERIFCLGAFELWRLHFKAYL